MWALEQASMVVNPILGERQRKFNTARNAARWPIHAQRPDWSRFVFRERDCLPPQGGSRSQGKCRACFSSVLVLSFCSLLVCISAKGGYSAEQRSCRSLRTGAVKHAVRGGRECVENDVGALSTSNVSQVTPRAQISGRFDRVTNTARTRQGKCQ